MSEEKKQRLKEEFIDESHEEPQRLFHLNRLPEKKELFEFIASMINNDERSQGVVDEKLKKPSSRKRDKEGRISKVVNQEKSLEEINFSENKESALNRVVVMDDLMNKAFNSCDKDVNSTMNLLMMKLSHHNNISVLLVCHELYPKDQIQFYFVTS